jgi:hypothetical protein
MQHIQTTEEKSAARRFWDEQMEKHPTLHGILSILSSIIEFFTGGHFIVRLGHKVVLTGGVIAETSLLFATLWVTADYTIPDFLRKFMSADLMSSFSSLSQAAFSLLPEIILASAIVTTIHHWKIASTNWNSKHWIWASLFSAPTATFLILTLYTISTFTSQDGSIAQATGAALAIRCFAGYSYALLELIYARIGKHAEQVVSQQEHLKTVEELHLEHEQRIAALESQHQQALAELTEKHERQLGQMDLQQQQRLLTTIQEVQSSASAIDYEALTEAVTKNLEARFEAQLEARMRQHTTVSEAQLEARNVPQIEAPKTPEAKKPASRGKEAASNILTLRQASTTITGVKAEVYQLADQGLSSYQIAPRVGKSAATIQRWIKERPKEQQNADHEAAETHEAESEAAAPAM